MSAFVGKSGPLTTFNKWVSSSSGLASGCSSAQKTPSDISRKLCGGMFVAIPTAIPALPLTSKFGKRLGNTSGSSERPS